MNFKKVNWGLSIIVIASLTTFILTKKKEYRDDNFQYGKDFNKTRDSLGVPKIESDCVTHESSDSEWLWSNKNLRVNTITPMHYYKISKFNDNILTVELDAYHYETDDSLAFRVVYQFNFDELTWDNEIIKYRKEKYPPTESWKLSLDQADSVLNKWGLRR